MRGADISKRVRVPVPSPLLHRAKRNVVHGPVRLAHVRRVHRAVHPGALPLPVQNRNGRDGRMLVQLLVLSGQHVRGRGAVLVLRENGARKAVSLAVRPEPVRKREGVRFPVPIGTAEPERQVLRELVQHLAGGPDDRRAEVVQTAAVENR